MAGNVWEWTGGYPIDEQGEEIKDRRWTSGGGFDTGIVADVAVLEPIQKHIRTDIAYMLCYSHECRACYPGGQAQGRADPIGTGRQGRNNPVRDRSLGVGECGAVASDACRSGSLLWIRFSFSIVQTLQ